MHFRAPCHGSSNLRINMRGSPAGQRDIITMAESYISSEQHRAAVAAFSAAIGTDTDDVKIAIDEAFNVWPMPIRADKS
jgi:hypothetical protein